jgi:tetratricopeptide (TPR) repeat protein
MKKTFLFGAVFVVIAGALYSQPYDADFYIGRAYESSMQGNPLKEFENLEMALKYDPNNIRALSMRGTFYARNGDYAQAKTDFERAYKLAPYSAETQHNLDYLNSLLGLYQPERIVNQYSSEIPPSSVADSTDATEYPPNYAAPSGSQVAAGTRRSDVELYYEDYSAASRYLNTQEYVPAGGVYDHSKGLSPGPDPLADKQIGTAIMERANPPPPPPTYTIYPSPDAYPPGTPTGRNTASAYPPPAYTDTSAAPQTVYTNVPPAYTTIQTVPQTVYTNTQPAPQIVYTSPQAAQQAAPASPPPAYNNSQGAPQVFYSTSPAASPVYINRGGVVYDARQRAASAPVPKPLPSPDAANSLRINTSALRSGGPSPIRIVSSQSQLTGRDMIKQVAIENPKMDITEATTAVNNAGVKLTHAGRFDQAIAEFSTAISYSPQFAIAYNNRGVAYACKGEYEKALIDFNNALRLNPYYFDAQANREDVKMTLAVK